MRGPAVAAAVAILTGAPALAADPQPDPACTPEAAQPATVSRLARDPAAFAGKCVKLQGHWRDTGLYPTHAEAAQPDALSIATLDGRRVGLYLREGSGPPAPTLAEIVGTAGDCAALGRPGDAGLTGYCRHRPGAYLAVVSAAAK